MKVPNTACLPAPRARFIFKLVAFGSKCSFYLEPERALWEVETTPSQARGPALLTRITEREGRAPQSLSSGPPTDRAGLPPDSAEEGPRPADYEPKRLDPEEGESEQRRDRLPS